MTNVWFAKSLVQIVRPTRYTITIRLNVGNITTNTKARVKGYGIIWFNPNYITTIILLKYANKKYLVTYEITHDSDFFVCQTGRSDMRFVMHIYGLKY